MEKKIVTINVGSEIVSKRTGKIDKIISIDLDNFEVNYDTGRDHFGIVMEEYLDESIKSINGIPVSEIEEVRIAGYNDKVTLKVGDIFTHDEDMISDKRMVITEFKNGEIIRNPHHTTPFLDFDYWYVNGKKYHRDDIIILNHSGKVNEMIELVGNTDEVFEITKDNIVQVLDYNGIPQDWFMIIRGGDNDFISFGRGFDSEFGVDTVDCRINLDSSNWLQHIELEVGKLKPLPKFDFKQYLIDNGLKIGYHSTNHGINIYPQNDGKFECNHKHFDPTKENANILIAMAKLAKELE